MSDGKHNLKTMNWDINLKDFQAKCGQCNWFLLAASNKMQEERD